MELTKPRTELVLSHMASLPLLLRCVFFISVHRESQPTDAKEGLSNCSPIKTFSVVLDDAVSISADFHTILSNILPFIDSQSWNTWVRNHLIRSGVRGCYNTFPVHLRSVDFQDIQVCTIISIILNGVHTKLA